MGNDKENVLDKTIKEVYDEQIYKDQMGQKTTVKRHNVGGEGGKYHNNNLKHIGLEIKEGEPTLREAEYLGSIAVHYYRTPITKVTVFVSQTGSLDKTPEIIVQDGITDLRNACLEAFNHRAQLKRSGF